MLDILSKGAPGDPAIRAPERPPLTFDALRQLAKDTIARLNALGIGRNDRVAIVLPNGPEMAAAFVAIAARRDHRAAQSGVSRGRVRVLPDRPSRQGAGRSARTGTRRRKRSRPKLGVPVLRLESEPTAPAGQFRLAGESDRQGVCDRAPRSRATSRWCSTPPARRRARRSCRSPARTSPRRRKTSARRWR